LILETFSQKLFQWRTRISQNILFLLICFYFTMKKKTPFFLQKNSFMFLVWIYVTIISKLMINWRFFIFCSNFTSKDTSLKNFQKHDFVFISILEIRDILYRIVTGLDCSSRKNLIFWKKYRFLIFLSISMFVRWRFCTNSVDVLQTFLSKFQNIFFDVHKEK